MYVMMRQATIISVLLAFISCGVVNSENDPPPEGWFEIEVPLGEEENAYNIQDLYFLNRDVGWIVGRKTVEKGNRGYLGFTENGGETWQEQFPPRTKAGVFKAYSLWMPTWPMPPEAHS